MARPAFASEKLLPAPYLGCRIASDWNATSLATTLESARWDSGVDKGRAAKRADLRRGWAGFLSTADDNGIPDQGDVAAYHKAMFPDLPLPTLLATKDFDSVWQRVGDDAISIALDLSALPESSPLRKWTGPVGHQVVLWKLNKDGTRAKVLDPMVPHSNSHTGYWVDKADVRKAAKAIGEGTVYAEAYPIGGWTREQLMRQKKNRQLNLVGKALDKAQAERDAAVQALKDCEEECTPCDEQLDAQRDAILDRFHTLEMEIRDA